MAVTNKEILTVLDAVERFLSITLASEQLGPDAQMGSEDILIRVQNLVHNMNTPPRPPKDVLTTEAEEPDEELYDDIVPGGDDMRKKDDNNNGRRVSGYIDMSLGQSDGQETYEEPSIGTAGTDFPPPPADIEPENYEVAEWDQFPPIPQELTSEQLPQWEEECDGEEITEEEIKQKLKQLESWSPEQIKNSCVCSGYLHKYKKKIFSTKYHKRFCVVKDYFLFYFISETDSKEKGVIILPGYKICVEKRNNDSSSYVFKFQPLVKGRAMYLFQADTKEELEMWQSALDPICRLKLSKSDSLERFTKDYEEKESICGNNEGSAVEAIQPMGEDEEMYEFIDDKGLKGVIPPSTRYNIPSEETYDDVRIESMTAEEEYDDICAAPVEQDVYEDIPGEQLLKMRMTNLPVVTTPPAPIVEDIYEELDTSRVVSRPLPNQLQIQQPVKLPSLPPPRSPLLPRGSVHEEPPPPPLPNRNPVTGKMISGNHHVEEYMPPPPELGKTPFESDFSYDNVYLGLYNCKAEDTNELSFTRGDVIYILDKVDVRWWMGFLHGKVGLVPCSYLTEGFAH